ncbi:hypothetical protein [Gordonia sp. OPL2]|uniref:hypothetical protein n=1 Tax=Gordonia sp. OPL2 TaxID=2486274 RepID=UPI0016560F40|nr:hypothetical protein [Gordonia sp. OPL2]ROZ89008.1 hypothetical protein EEB19_20075 [Gordonia sp. OPL2]
MIDFSAYDLLIPEDDDRLADLDLGELEAVCDAIRNWCGWHVAPEVTETLTLDQIGHRVLTLPSLHVTEVAAVTDADGRAITDFEWRDIGQLKRRNGWPVGYRAVKVTLTHGFATVPPEIVSVAIHMLEERADAADHAGNIKTAQLDGAAITYDSTATALMRDLDTYSHAIGRYRL